MKIAPKYQQIEVLLGQNTLKLPIFFCKSGFKVERLCSNKICKFQAMCCDEDACDYCESLHENCSTIKFKQLNKKVEERLYIKNKILRNIFNIENQLINKLVASRKETIEESAYWNLEGKSSEVISSIYLENNIESLSGKDINILFAQLSQKSILEIPMNEYFEYYQKQGNQIIKDLLQVQRNIIQSLIKGKKIEVKMKDQLKITSKILRDQKQPKYSFLTNQLQNPTEFKLLFRASEHDFSAAKFHQFCDGKGHTLTIVRTQFGKTIAAYTPLKWSSINGFATDLTKSSFLLQLDLQQKMELLQGQKAIENNIKYGPLFGASDLCLADKAHQNKKNYSNFPYSYNYKERYLNSQQSYNAFCGCTNGMYFDVLEYEVFEVKWQE